MKNSMKKYLFTIHYDALNVGNDAVNDAVIDEYYNAHPFHKTCDVLEIYADTYSEAYYKALDASDITLSISHVDIFENGEWVNWRTIGDGIDDEMKKVVKSHLRATFKK